MSFNFGFGLYNHTTPCLRIAYDPATNLATESSANRGKFMLDTVLGTQLGYLNDIYSKGYDSRYQTGGWFNGNVDNWFFYNLDLDHADTSGNKFNGIAGAAIVWNHSGSGSQSLFLFDNWYPYGYMPLIETRWLNPAYAANTYEGATVNYAQFQVTGTGYVESIAAVDIRTSISFATGQNSYPFPSGREIVLRNNGTNSTYRVSVFQLPQRDDALPDFSTTPVSGQQVLLLNPTTARLALPGRDVTDTNIDHFIFHENKIPAKIMAAGDINVAGSGVVDIPCPLPLNSNTYMDFMIKRQTDTEFWNPPYFDSIASNKSLKFQYFVDIANQKVTITNLTTTAVVIRYIIFADNDDAPTTGGKKVFYKGNDGTRDFVQIKRPGSSDVAPSLSDILVDSRLAYMPILAQGFLNWTSDFPTVVTGSNLFRGERMTTINVANPSPSLKLFTKQIVVYDKQCDPVVTRGNYHKVFTDAGGWTGRASADSTWSMIHSDESAVDFYMAGDNPISCNGSTANFMKKMIGTSSYTGTSALGMRYYIFGIPAAL